MCSVWASSFCCTLDERRSVKETNNRLFSFVHRSLCNFPFEWLLKNSSKKRRFLRKKKKQAQRADHEKLMMSWGLLREWTILIRFRLLHFNWRWHEHSSRRRQLFTFMTHSPSSKRAALRLLSRWWSKTIIHSPEITKGDFTSRWGNLNFCFMSFSSLFLSSETRRQQKVFSSVTRSSSGLRSLVEHGVRRQNARPLRPPKRILFECRMH